MPSSRVYTFLVSYSSFSAFRVDVDYCSLGAASCCEIRSTYLHRANNSPHPPETQTEAPNYRETHSFVLGCEKRPFSASIMSRSCFASSPVCVYKFSSHDLNNIIFIDNSLGPLARESPCIFVLQRQAIVILKRFISVVFTNK